jgi:hypothetical protein
MHRPSWINITRPRWAALLWIELLALTLFLTFGAQPQSAQAYGGRTQGAVVAFYYPWYDNRNAASWWDSSKMTSLPATQYQSSDMNYVRSQMTTAATSGIDAFAVTWNGPTGDWANRFNSMLGMNTGLYMAVHYETGLLADKSVNATITNLRYIRDSYATNPNYFRYEGKPVVFFWQPQNIGSMSDWQNIRNQVDPNHEEIWSVDGIDVSVLSVFDSMHLFSAAKWDDNPVAKDKQFRQAVDAYAAAHGGRKLWTAGVTPGYDDRKFRSPGEFRDRANGDYYKKSWLAAIGSQPDMITISTWNEWYEGSSIEAGQLWGNTYTDLTKEYTQQYKGAASLTFNDASVAKVWSRTDLPIRTGATSRTWLWGPNNNHVVREHYSEGPNGYRMVYYFDKSRMEITHPTADPNAEWFVTNGLLVREMMLGKLATGDNATQAKSPANIPVAGDPNNNPNSPTFASMARVASLANDKRSSDQTGNTITATLSSSGQVGNNAGLTQYGVTYAHYENALGHNIASPFWSFFQQNGPVYENGGIGTAGVIDWVFAMGYPISEPYWCKVKVGGVERDVLVQAFERRIMTYTPANWAAYQVEMGNVGSQYYSWRYGN